MTDEKIVRQLANAMRPVLFPVELACLAHQQRNQAAVEALAREALNLWELRRTDAERLQFLEDCDGWALVSDDAGHWALVTEGFQNILDDVPKDKWKKTVREAIDVIMDES